MSDSNNISDPFKIIAKYEEAAAACNRCGFCTSYCPTYKATGNEAYSPRGRVQIFRALIDGNLADPLAAGDIIDTCLLCGECTSVCFSEVPTADLMVHARHFLNEIRGVPKGLQFILTKLLPNPKLFSMVLKIAFLGKRLGISKLLQKTGLLKKISPELSNADLLMTQVPSKFLADFEEAKAHQESSYTNEALQILTAQKKSG